MADLNLTSTESIHLFFSDYENAPLAGDRRYVDHVSESERSYAESCSTVRQKEFLVGRALLRHVLSQFVPGVDPINWRFKTNPFGKPEIESPVGGSRLKFNLAHCKGVLVLAVGELESLGVDVENTVRTGNLDDIARLHFSPEEYADLCQDTLLFVRRFIEYWTLKEAFIKAIGLGLSLPLNQFTARWNTSRTEVSRFQILCSDGWKLVHTPFEPRAAVVEVASAIWIRSLVFVPDVIRC